MTPQESRPNRWQDQLLPLLIGLGVAIVCGTLLLLLAAVLIQKVDVPHGALAPLAITAAGIGAFIGGLTAALCARRRGLVMGAICGGLLYALLLLAGYLYAGGVDPGAAVIKLVVLTVCGAIGGILGVNRR